MAASELQKASFVDLLHTHALPVVVFTLVCIVSFVFLKRNSGIRKESSAEENNTNDTNDVPERRQQVDQDAPKTDPSRKTSDSDTKKLPPKATTNNDNNNWRCACEGGFLPPGLLKDVFGGAEAAMRLGAGQCYHKQV